MLPQRNRESSASTQRARDLASYTISAVLLGCFLTIRWDTTSGWTALRWYLFRFVGGDLALLLPICAAFAIAAYLLRGVTRSGAIAGFVVAVILSGFFWGYFAQLLIVFVLSWAATLLGRAQKERWQIAETRRGRDGIQVLANTGLAAAATLIAVAMDRLGHNRISSCAEASIIAVLAESAADTVSSEIGKAFGGPPRLITNWERVPPGSNGGITLIGSLSGVLAVLLVAAAPIAIEFSRASDWRGFARLILPSYALLAVFPAVAGMFFDSLLGATLEGRWLNNDGVNFLSTSFAAGLAGLLGLMTHLH